MARTSPQTSTRKASALDTSLRLIEELAQAMSGQVQRGLRQIERAGGVSLPPRSVEALGSDARTLEVQCRGLRERVGLEEVSASASTAAAPAAYVPGTRGGSQTDAARTLALELQALGIERDEVANRLVNTFEVEDSEGIVDSVFVEP